MIFDLEIRGYNRLKSILVIFFFVVLFNYRYLRLFPIFNRIDFLVYGYIILIFILSIFYMFFQKKKHFLSYIPIFLFFGVISFVYMVYKYGLTTQIQYLLEGISFYPIIFYFLNSSIGNKYFNKILIVHTVVSITLLLLEFYFSNYLNFNLLSQHSLWAETRVDETNAPTLHGYTEEYFFFGKLERPWGFLAQPQSTGVFYAGLVVYFLEIFRKSKWVTSKWFYSLLAGYSFLGLFFTGSKTGYLIFLFLFTLFLNKNIRSELLKLVFGFFGFILTVYYFTIKFMEGLGEGGSSGGWLSTFERIEWSIVNYKYDWILGDGSNHLSSEALRNDFYILNLFLTFGPFLYVIFLFILFSIINFVINYKSELYIQYKYLMLALILGCMHYDSLTRFPMNVIFIISLSVLYKNQKRYGF